MRKLIAAINVTLDGFVARPDGSLDWHFRYWDGELGESLGQQLFKADTILLGRKTYTAMASYWAPKMNGLYQPREDLALTGLLNSRKKIVVSKKPIKPYWQNTVFLNGELTEQIQSLKAEPGKNIVVLGSVKLVAALTKCQLIDGYEIWVHPERIEKGLLFNPYLNKLDLKLIATRRLGSGVEHLSYEVV